MGMNFSTAKAIIKIFREEGRILKKAEQGEYDVSYKMFEKAVFKMLHQVTLRVPRDHALPPFVISLEKQRRRQKT